MLPVTDKELADHYGTPHTEVDRGLAIGWAKALFDAAELGDVIYRLYEEIEEELHHADNDLRGELVMLARIGRIVVNARNQRIADIASRRLFGETGHIKSDEVKV